MVCRQKLSDNVRTVRGALPVTPLKKKRIVLCNDIHRFVKRTHVAKLVLRCGNLPLSVAENLRLKSKLECKHLNITAPLNGLQTKVVCQCTYR